MSTLPSQPAPGGFAGAAARQSSRTYRGQQSDSAANGLPMWVKISMVLGFPTVACAFMGYAIWAAACWGANHVVEPVVNAHVTTLSKITETQGQLATTAKRLADQQEKQNESLDGIAERQDETNRLLRGGIQVRQARSEN